MNRTVGQNEVTPLDLAQFERSHARELAINVRDGAQPGVGQMLRAVEQFDALLAECKRLRAERAKLLEALRNIVILDDGDKPDLWHFEREFNAARALLDEDARSHGARTGQGDRVTKEECIHILRNPYGHSREKQREAALFACNEIEALENAYINMRDWAEQKGLDTVSRGMHGARV